MNWPTIASSRCRLAVALVGVSFVACSPEPTRVVEVPGAQFAKGGGGPTSTLSVTSTSPAFGKRGERLSVRVLGSGFNSTAEATWERGGVADPRIIVHNTVFVSSGEVIADVEITEDADLILYDVAVSIALTGGGRKKGIGIEMFEVTSATILPELSGAGNNSIAWSLTDAGQVVGRSKGHAFFWDPVSGIEDLGSGEALDVTQSGTMMVGANGITTSREAVVWTGSAGSWTAAKLSTACLSSVSGSVAQSVAGDGSLIGGTISVTVSRKQTLSYGVLWDGPASSCRVLANPAGYTNGRVNEVNALGMAAGGASAAESRAVVWDPAGVPTLLAPVPGDSWSGGQAISPDGSIVTGLSGNRAAYWVRTETGWSVGIPLTPPCGGSVQSSGRGANSSGMIVGRGCDGGRWWQVSGATVVASGLMPGVGTPEKPTPEAVSENSLSGEAWAVGGGPGAVLWRRP